MAVIKGAMQRKHCSTQTKLNRELSSTLWHSAGNPSEGVMPAHRTFLQQHWDFHQLPQHLETKTIISETLCQAKKWISGKSSFNTIQVRSQKDQSILSKNKTSSLSTKTMLYRRRANAADQFTNNVADTVVKPGSSQENQLNVMKAQVSKWSVALSTYAHFKLQPP